MKYYYEDRGIGTYCSDHPGGYNAGQYLTQQACEDECTARAGDCVAYDFFGASQWCVLAPYCNLLSGGDWTHVDKIFTGNFNS